jgi:nitroimidazol reductase NimA-like FMN-containing flavoprotein (pyridoxamine 5'-phosphate oxidase superfamily)
MPDPLPSAPTDRTRLRRRAQRGSHDRAVIDAIVDEALVCHLAFVGAAGPMVLPTTHVRVGDHLYVHGSAVNAMLTTLAGGVDLCVAITLLDGLVLGRTAFHHSVNYRSIVAFGRATLVEDPAIKRRALAALIEKVEPGRSAACRPPNDKELGATLVLALPLDEASAKIRTGPPVPDDGEDAALPFWSGVIPIVTSRGAPNAAPAEAAAIR